MEFEAGLVVSFVLMIAAFVVDWPRALAGLAFGAISRYLPYGTIVVPTGVIVLAAAGEFIYPADRAHTRTQASARSRSGSFRSPRRLRISI